MNGKKLLLVMAAGAFCVSSLPAQLSIIGQLDHIYDVVPGGLYEGSIEVSNPGIETQEVKAYQTDYFFYSDGTNLYGEPGGLPRSNARWMTLSPRQIIVPPGETIAFKFSIQVPDDATLKGTYWSMVMIEPIPLSSAESTLAPVQSGVGIAQVLRYGVQIITQVGRTGAKQIKFNALSLVAEGGKRSLVADVLNTGEQWLRGKFSVDLYDSTGVFIGKYVGDQKRTYPQTSVRYTVDLVGVPNGTYKALIVVDCGGDDVFGVNVNLVLKD